MSRASIRAAIVAVALLTLVDTASAVNAGSGRLTDSPPATPDPFDKQVAVVEVLGDAIQAMAWCDLTESESAEAVRFQYFVTKMGQTTFSVRDVLDFISVTSLATFTLTSKWEPESELAKNCAEAVNKFGKGGSEIAGLLTGTGQPRPIKK